MIEMIRELCALDGVSGYEAPVREYIRRMAEPYAEEIRTDVFGNLFVLKKGGQTPAAPVAVSAGMSEYGFIVDDFGDEGAMKLMWLDEMDVRNVIGRRFHVARTGAKGVISLVAQHLTGRSGTDSVPEFKEVQFDFGGSKKEDAGELVKPGDTLAFDYPVREFGENCLRGSALDCRLGCALMLRLIREVTPKYDTWFIFTASKYQEHQGAIVAARQIDPAVCLMLDACACCDVPMQTRERVNARLRRGAAVALKERRILFSRALREALCEKASAAGIPWQLRTAVQDTSDAGTMQISASGMQVVSISVPVRGMSSANPVAYIPDITAAYEMAGLFVTEVDEAYVR